MKGIKTILGALAIASLLAVSLNASAQENNNRDENGQVVRGAYETNGFWDNWFIGVGGGWNAGVRNWTGGDKYGGYFKSGPDLAGPGGLALDVNIGKWFTPSVGARVGWKGVANGIGKAIVWPKGDFLKGEGTQHFVHVDLLWNISNAIGGYKETRFWDVIPYATFGGLWVAGDREFAPGLGLLNDFRLGNHVDLFLDLQMLCTHGWQYPGDVKVNGTYFYPATATVGLIFNLGRTNWDRHSSITPVVIPVPFTVDQYNALKDKVAALEKENAALKNQIKGLEDELAKFKGLKDGQEYLYKDGKFIPIECGNGISTPAAVYFDLGKSTLSQRELAHLEFFANNGLGDAKEIVLTGSADSKTGSAKLNQSLSEKRAEYVKNLLVKNYGIAADKIKTNALGGVMKYPVPAKNRVVTIEAK